MFGVFLAYGHDWVFGELCVCEEDLFVSFTFSLFLLLDFATIVGVVLTSVDRAVKVD